VPEGSVDRKMWKKFIYVIKFGINPHQNTLSGDDDDITTLE
jgi:hypothetical protein